MAISFAHTHKAESPFAGPHQVGEGQHPEKMQGHWLLARAGKRVLRPGGLELTKRLLEALAITGEDRVVEFAPGLGITARMTLRRRPLAYWGVEREPAAAENLRNQLPGNAEIVLGSAQESGLPSGCASVVYGEAFLSMQSREQKARIFAEVRRLLAPGGRYGIHELCYLPDNLSEQMRHDIQVAMSKEIHVGVHPMTCVEWIQLFEEHGLRVSWRAEAPMHLLEPRRVLQDEGWRGALRVGFNVASQPLLRRRILAMRQVFRKYEKHLGAISFVCRCD